MIIFKLFPQGKQKVLTFSYDDGVSQDIRLVEIFDKYGMKGTFNVNSGLFGASGSSMVKGKSVHRERIKAEDIKELYQNHEVAIHTVTHPSIGEMPKDVINYELLQDKIAIEELVGYPVRGSAYPNGSHSPLVTEAMKQLGIEYGRTVPTHETFELPSDYLLWDGTCHHNNPKLMELLAQFLGEPAPRKLWLFYVWGHSYEFDDNDNWDIIENFCKAASNLTDVWYATNIEIVDYLNAANSLKFSSKGTSVYNPSGIDVFMNINGEVVEIKKGNTIQL